MRTPNGHPGAQGMPQIRQQVNISGQQQRLSNPLLGQTRIASSQQVMQAQAAQAQARAIAAQVAQAQAHPGIANSLAAGAAPALTAHLTPNYNTARPSSTSPGLPQHSPPLSQAAAANATSPRPPSAQAQALAGLSPQVQASIAASAQRNAPAMAHYYSNMQAGHLTPEQIQHAMQIRTLISQVCRPFASTLCAKLMGVFHSNKLRCNSSRRNSKLSNKMVTTPCHRSALHSLGVSISRAL